MDDGRGIEFGTRTHEFAEQYALGEAVEASNDDERHIKRFIDSLGGERQIEEDAYLPLTAGGERISIYGIIDLVHLCPGTVKIIDFKIDRSRVAKSEYRKQLSVYYHVLSEWFPERDMTASIFYTTTSEQVDIDPLSKSELGRLVERVNGTSIESASLLE